MQNSNDYSLTELVGKSRAELEAYFKEHALSPNQEEKIFPLSNKLDVLWAYLGVHRPSFATELRILDLPLDQAKMLLHRYLSEQHHHLCLQAEQQLILRKDLRSLFKWYVSNSELGSDDVEVFMMTQPDAEELLEIYLKHNYLHPRAEALLFKLPHPNKFVELYISNMVYFPEARLTEASEAKIFELKNAREILKKYIDIFPLYKNNEMKLLDKEYGLEILRPYIEKHCPSNDLIMSLSQRREYELINIFRHKYLP